MIKSILSFLDLQSICMQAITMAKITLLQHLIIQFSSLSSDRTDMSNGLILSNIISTISTTKNSRLLLLLFSIFRISLFYLQLSTEKCSYEIALCIRASFDYTRLYHTTLHHTLHMTLDNTDSDSDSDRGSEVWV